MQKVVLRKKIVNKSQTNIFNAHFLGRFTKVFKFAYPILVHFCCNELFKSHHIMSRFCRT